MLITLPHRVELVRVRKRVRVRGEGLAVRG